MGKTAGIVTIGNEILLGMVKDHNGMFMAKQLRSHGIKLCRISVIPDDVDEIAAVVKEFSESLNYVFTSGGLGPTHDDVTIEGVSKAYNVKPVIDHYLKSLLHERFGRHLTSEKLKMAQIPQGAELIKDEALKFPLIKYKNIYIYPGVPKLLRKQFYITRKHIHGGQTFLAKLYIDDHESEVAPFLNEVVNHDKGVRIGSYSIIVKGHFLILLMLESYSERKLNLTLAKLVDKFSKEKIIGVEYQGILDSLNTAC